MAVSDIKIKYTIDTSDLSKAQQGFDNLTKEEQDALAALKKFNNELDQTGTKADNATEKAGKGFSDMEKMANKVGGAIAGYFAVDKLMSFGKAVLEITGKFQTFSAVLTNSLGSSSAANAAMTMIKDFAAKTPFSVEQLTNSFVKLANAGFKPTADQMRKLGDLASSTGKSFDQLAEAIIDAQTGEFERLKEFGIRAQKAGDNVKFTFKGVETQTKMTSAAIQQYVLSLGDAIGVSGSMDAISKTLDGQISNLGDAWDNFLLTIGNRLGPVFSKVIGMTSEFLATINDLFKTEEQKATEFSGTQMNVYSKKMKGLSDEAVGYVAANAVNRLKIEEDNVKKLQVLANEEIAARQAVMAENRIAMDIGKGQTEIKLDEAKKIVLSLKAQIDASNEEIKSRALAAKAASAASEENMKALTKQYEAKVKQFEIDEKIAKLQLETSLLGQKGAVVEEQKLAFANRYGKERARIDAMYSDMGVIKAKENLGIQVAENTKTNKELEMANASMTLSTYKNSKEFAEAAEKEKTASAKAGIDARNNLKMVEVESTKASEQDMLNEIKRIQDEKIAVILAGVELAAQAYQGFTDLYTANLDQEMAAANARFDEEKRLAGDNVQKLTEIDEKRAAKEKEIRIAKFKAEQAAAVAQVVFRTAPIIAEYIATGVLAPLAAMALASAAVQTAFILAQPVPEYAEGTKGKAHKGGKAIVGERGTERVVTESGKVYYTPPTATLLDLPAGSQVIPNHLLGKEELFMASSYARGGAKNGGSSVSGQLSEIGTILKGLPIHQIQMDEQGFQKFIRTEKRTTKILNNRFPSHR